MWEMLLVSENFNHASVLIILDGCGFANAWPLAQKVYLRLAERSFLLNQDNWDSYMECMCRVGRLNDAVKMVCLDMGNVQKDMIPNKVTVRLLLMFTARLNQQDETLLHPTIPSGPVGELATSPWGVCHKANTHRDTI